MANLNRMTFLMSISEITPQIFLAGQMAATLEQVHRLGITYILNVAVESSAIAYPKHVKLEKFDIIDFPTAPIGSYFNTLTDKIHAHLSANKNNKVLVHCMAGISRSTTIVCAYLMRYMHMSLRDAYLLCKKHRPICFPNLGFWAQLISYEHQLRKENSVRMISTQFGQIPDVALEEIKQMRQQMPLSMPFSPPTFVSAPSNPAYSSYAQNDSSYHPSNQPRATVRDMSISNSNGTVRSRSLAPNQGIRPSIVAASTHVSNPAYQTPIFATNKQVFSNPTRFDIRRLNPAASVAPSLPPPAPAGSSLSFASSRSMPVYKSSNTKPATNNYPSLARQQPGSVTAREPNFSAHSGQPRSQYETTYRASFIKPLVP